MKSQFRIAVSSDRESLWQLIGPVIQSGGTYVFSQDSSEEKMMNYWINPDKRTYVAEWDGELVGTFYLKANQPDLGDHICNAGFMVSDQAKGKGVGRSMGLFALEEARRLGFQVMQFNFVIKTNVPALRLWLDLGFAIIGEIPEAYRHPDLGLVPAVIMYQKLF